MDKLERTATNHLPKLVIGITIGAFLIGGLLLFLWRYSSVLSDMSQQAVKNPLQQNAVSMTQIKEEYEANFLHIIGNYLKSSTTDDNFSIITGQTKEQILSLKVPGSYKELHKNTVLILAGIEASLAKRDLLAISAKFSELQKTYQELSSVSK